MSRSPGEVNGFDVTAYLALKHGRRWDVIVYFALPSGTKANKNSAAALTPDNAERLAVHTVSGLFTNGSGCRARTSR